MEIKDDTEVLRNMFAKLDPENDEVESVHKAELDAGHALTLMANPKAALKELGIPVSDESQVHVTMKQRADRSAMTLAQASAIARMRRIIIIIIHYRNCDSDIIIFASR